MSNAHAIHGIQLGKFQCLTKKKKKNSFHKKLKEIFCYFCFDLILQFDRKRWIIETFITIAPMEQDITVKEMCLK